MATRLCGPLPPTRSAFDLGLPQGSKKWQAVAGPSYANKRWDRRQLWLTGPSHTVRHPAALPPGWAPRAYGFSRIHTRRWGRLGGCDGAWKRARKPRVGATSGRLEFGEVKSRHRTGVSRGGLQGGTEQGRN